MQRRPLVRIPVPPGPEGVQALWSALAGALCDDGPAIAPIPVVSAAVSAEYVSSLVQAAAPNVELEDERTAVVLTTSGSTGAPRGVELDSSAVRASAHGAAAALGLDLSSTAWVVALPITSAGGFNVLARAWLAGSTPVALPSLAGAQPYHPDEWTAAVRRCREANPDADLLTSMVPAQLQRALQDPDATAALRTLTAVLVGGARASQQLVEAAAGAGVRVVRTYGMTETCGGCVFDGIPFPGTAVRQAEQSELLLSGPTMMRRYRRNPELTAVRLRDGWLRTGDVGAVRDGVVSVDGRLDDVIQVRGTAVSLGAVERVLSEVLGAGDVAVIGVPVADGGHRIVAFVTGSTPEDALLDAVARSLGRAGMPSVVRLASLPRLASGKFDRRALQALIGE